MKQENTPEISWLTFFGNSALAVYSTLGNRHYAFNTLNTVKSPRTFRIERHSSQQIYPVAHLFLG
jgi:hypothetical protein